MVRNRKVGETCLNLFPRFGFVSVIFPYPFVMGVPTVFQCEVLRISVLPTDSISSKEILIIFENFQKIFVEHIQPFIQRGILTVSYDR
jgi:hypothetical protein